VVTRYRAATQGRPYDASFVSFFSVCLPYFSGIMPDKMRLSKELIQHIADSLTANLAAKDLLKYDVPAGVISARINEIITANMLEEDKLNRDVEKLLSAHEAEIAKGQMDYRKVFDLTKQKLAKDRGFVL